jgi:hypothetical protein
LWRFISGGLISIAAGDTYMRSTGPQSFVRERRSTVRENVSIPAKMTFQSKTIDVTVVDLSDRGLAIRSSSVLTGGTCVEIHLSLPGAEPVQCNGIVAWATKEMAGIEFSFVAASAAEILDEWLRSHSLSQ